jgi:hypothetical protein
MQVVRALKRDKNKSGDEMQNAVCRFINLRVDMHMNILYNIR